MGRLLSVIRRPRALPDIIVLLTHLPRDEVMSLVNATRTLEIVRMDSGSRFPTNIAGINTRILPIDERESLRWMAVQYEVYYVQTKVHILDSASYSTRMRIIFLAPGFQIPGRTTVSCLFHPPVLPPGLLEKISISHFHTYSAAQPLRHILSGADQFAEWKSSWKEIGTWWFRLLGPWGPLLAVLLLISSVLFITSLVMAFYDVYDSLKHW